MSRRLRILISLLVVVSALPLLTAAGGGKGPQSEHQRIIEFWTQERVAQAQPRDFRFDPSTRQFTPAARPPGGGGNGDGGIVSGSSWTKGGAVTGTTGKVLFQMGGSYWVCSASTVYDTAADRSIVLTAGHCVYDEANGAFATNWMFIPDYDAAPAPLTSSGSFCSETRYGCWTAESLAVHTGYATAGGFNDQAVLYDWGFAVVKNGGLSGTDLVEAVVGTQNIAFSSVALNGSTTGWAFGYPAEKKWDGTDLIYCRGPVDGDPYNANLTYRMSGCKLNGGSSGGPWFRDFSESTGVGTLFSVNSYGYNGVTAMHGPLFNASTQATYNSALTQPSSTIVP